MSGADELTNLREQLDGLSREHSRLNDRYMALLHDQQRDREAVIDAALYEARSRAQILAGEAMREISNQIYAESLIQAATDLPDKPTPQQVRDLRMLATAHRARWINRKRLNPLPVAVELVCNLRATHHESVIRWQEKGGRTDDLPEGFTIPDSNRGGQPVVVTSI